MEYLSYILVGLWSGIWIPCLGGGSPLRLEITCHLNSWDSCRISTKIPGMTTSTVRIRLLPETVMGGGFFFFLVERIIQERRNPSGRALSRSKDANLQQCSWVRIRRWSATEHGGGDLQRCRREGRRHTAHDHPADPKMQAPPKARLSSPCHHHRYHFLLVLLGSAFSSPSPPRRLM